MTDLIEHRSDAHHEQPVPGRKHHRRRWIVAGLAALLALAGVGLLLLSPGPAPVPLTLPKPGAQVAGASGPIGGAWTIGPGSLAGYRVQEKVAGFSDTVVGRTSAVSGRVVIAHGNVLSASFRVNLTTVTANGKTQPKLASIMNTAKYPAAVFTLTNPIVPASPPTANSQFNVMATGVLVMHGTSRPVTFAIAARRSGSVIDAAGSIPIQFSNWNIQVPSYGSVISLQNNGVVEFSIVLHR